LLEKEVGRHKGSSIERFSIPHDHDSSSKYWDWKKEVILGDVKQEFIRLNDYADELKLRNMVSSVVQIMCFDGWTIISDGKGKPITTVNWFLMIFVFSGTFSFCSWIDAVSREHRRCACRHIFAKQRKTHKGQNLQKQFWICAEMFGGIKNAALEDFADVNSECWRWAFFKLSGNWLSKGQWLARRVLLNQNLQVNWGQKHGRK